MDKKELFTAAIKDHAGIIYKIASLYTNDFHDRYDLVQEIYYQLWKSFDSFARRSALSTWIYRVAMNAAIYHLKSAKRKIKTVELDEANVDFHDRDSPDIEEQVKLFHQHLDKLGLLEKGIVMLYLENKSHEEIAQIIGISVSNVGTRISRIKEKLKTQISKHL